MRTDGNYIFVESIQDPTIKTERGVLKAFCDSKHCKNRIYKLRGKKILNENTFMRELVNADRDWNYCPYCSYAIHWRRVQKNGQRKPIRGVALTPGAKKNENK